MNIFDRITGKSEQRLAAQLREVQVQLEGNSQLMRESIMELEQQLMEQGWQRIAGDVDREFSRQGLAAIMKLSRLMFLKNPLVNRAVTLQAIYVWAQGVQITSTDEDVQAVCDAFLADKRNQVELTGHQARTMKEQDLQVLGNLFLALFTSPVDGSTVVRSLPPEEVQQIVTNPDDAKEPWFYKRCWKAQVFDVSTGQTKQEQREAYYPDIDYAQDARPESIGGKPVMWDSPVYHVRVGGLSDMQFGVPETYQAIDWARAYNAFLEDWATIVRAYARFAFKVTAAGGKAGVAAAKTRLGTTLGATSETNPAPVVGSTFIGSQGADLAPVKTAGATTSADDGRHLKLQVCAAFGMPESFFGDVSVGTLATAKSLDRPTELKFRDRQELWKSILDTILQYVVKMSRGAASGRMRMVGKDATERAPIDITFPPILEHDIAEQMAAIVSGATLNGSPNANTIDRETITKLILTNLGVADVQAVIDVLKPAWEEEDARAADAAANLPTPGGKQADPNADPGVTEAVRGLREAIDALRKKVAA